MPTHVEFVDSLNNAIVEVSAITHKDSKGNDVPSFPNLARALIVARDYMGQYSMTDVEMQALDKLVQDAVFRGTRNARWTTRTKVLGIVGGIVAVGFEALQTYLIWHR